MNPRTSEGSGRLVAMRGQLFVVQKAQITASAVVGLQANPGSSCLQAG